MVIHRKHLEMTMKNMNLMEMMMSLMTETKVGLVQVEEKYPRSLQCAPEGIFDDDKDPEDMTLQELIDAQPDHWRKGKAGTGRYTSVMMGKRSN